MAKPGKAVKRAARSARLKAALRQNLKKRKQQAKQRELARNRVPLEQTSVLDGELTTQASDFRRNRGGN